MDSYLLAQVGQQAAQDGEQMTKAMYPAPQVEGKATQGGKVLIQDEEAAPINGWLFSQTG